MEIINELYFPVVSATIVLAAIYFKPSVSFIVAIALILVRPVIVPDVSMLSFSLAVVIYMALWWLAAYRLDKSKRIGFKEKP